MKATGIIVEYNPFHNGHKYHAEEAKKSTNADIVVAVMSGNFLQRGEPAFIDKWARTHMALANGVDLLFELPYAFATAHAPIFAKGAIQLLDAAHCSAYCFGSEDGEIQPFENSLTAIRLAGDDYEQKVKEAVRGGISYPKALNEAYIFATQGGNHQQPVADLTKPNNILGFHYIQAAQDIGSAMQAATIPRVAAGFHDDAVVGNSIASATGIRKSFFESNTLQTVSTFFPDETHANLRKWQERYHAFGSWEHFYPFLRFTILREGPKQLTNIADMTEGIENLIYRAATAHSTFEDFMGEVKSKRYTWTRIQRILTHIFTGFTYDMRSETESPSYLRLLGMTGKGQLYLNQHKKMLKLPLISKAANFASPSLSLDIHAANMYALGIAGNSGYATISSDYTNQPILLK